MTNDETFPSRGRLLAIDYGHVRLGFAVSDREQSIASPLQNYTRQNPAADATFLQRLVDEEQIAGIVIGLPVHLSGDESQKSQEARQFAAWVGTVTQMPLRFFDERYSTAAAEEFLAGAGLTSKKRKKRRDMLAAQVILASYLEAGNRNAPFRRE